MKRRTATVASVCAAAVGLVLVASTAWACTAFLQLSGPREATSLSQVTVTGSGLAGNKTVELRWNGAKGPVVGTARTADNGYFSTPVSVPDVAAGVYYVVATAEGTTPARLALQVTAKPGAEPAQSAATQVLSTGSRATSPAPSSSGSSALGFQLLAAGLALTVIGIAVVGTGATRRARSLGHASRRSDHIA